MAEIENIRNRIFNKHKSSLDSDVFWMCLVMQEFGYTLKEMKKMSITTFKILVIYLVEQNKAMQSSFKKPHVPHIRRPRR